MEKKWYIVNTHSAQELKAKLSIEDRIKKFKMEEDFGEILVPSESVVRVVRGQKKESSRKFFPGYIFVNMNLSEKTWHLVKGSAKVTGFVGSSMPPPAVPEEEVARITKQMEVGAEKPKHNIDFSEGDSVRVVDGPFSNFNGTVEQINLDKGKVKVAVSIFGRPTPVELDFAQVLKDNG